MIFSALLIVLMLLIFVMNDKSIMAEFFRDNLIKVLFFLLVVSGLIFTLHFFYTSNNLTSIEQNLLNFISLIFSTLASWIIAHFYADYSNNKNLKMFAEKAVEKVDNLSESLAKLTVFLKEELDNCEDSIELDLHSKKERITSAIQIINLLQSINEKSSSDWRGVMGGEYDRREKEKKDQIEDLELTLEKYQQVLESLGSSEKYLSKDGFEKDDLREEITSLNKKIDFAFSKLGAIPKSSREPVIGNCPRCKSRLNYDQRQKLNSFKKVKCENCNLDCLAKWDPKKGFTLSEIKPVAEIFKCSVCDENCEIKLNIMPGSSVKKTCPKCGNEMEIKRRVNALKIKNVGKVAESLEKEEIKIDEDFLELIKEKIPQQPWPKGTGKKLAEELDVSHAMVRKAIDTLIERGDFKVQIDGELFEKINK